MRIFISWSGARSQAIATAMRNWLPRLIDGVDLFHSEDIPKGRSWHSALVKALHDCAAGIFCVTPESLRSHWMLFEAGALVQHGDEPTLFTYLYGIDEAEGPLSHFQTTRFDREDSRRFVRAIAQLVGATNEQIILTRFEETWPAFESEVVANTLVPVQQLIADFPSRFDEKKTFHEPLPECSDKKWDDRLRRTARTLGYLSQPEIEAILSSDPYLRGAYRDLLYALDRYDMHIGAYLLKPVDFASLAVSERTQLEDARKRILDIVFGLQKQCLPPIFRESLAFESERATDKRKAQIHELEGKMRDDPRIRQLRPAGASLNWALDRIMYYLGSSAGLLPEAHLKDLIAALKGEEERARSRNLVDGLQPLYYAAECIDETLPDRIDEPAASRLLEVIGEIERFLDDHQGRDSGGHIRRRLASIRRKLEKR
jgi:TIR domain